MFQGIGGAVIRIFARGIADLSRPPDQDPRGDPAVACSLPGRGLLASSGSRRPSPVPPTGCGTLLVADRPGKSLLTDLESEDVKDGGRHRPPCPPASASRNRGSSPARQPRPGRSQSEECRPVLRPSDRRGEGLLPVQRRLSWPPGQAEPPSPATMPNSSRSGSSTSTRSCEPADESGEASVDQIALQSIRLEHYQRFDTRALLEAGRGTPAKAFDKAREARLNALVGRVFDSGPSRALPEVEAMPEGVAWLLLGMVGDPRRPRPGPARWVRLGHRAPRNHPSPARARPLGARPRRGRILSEIVAWSTADPEVNADGREKGTGTSASLRSPSSFPSPRRDRRPIDRQRPGKGDRHEWRVLKRPGPDLPLP